MNHRFHQELRLLYFLSPFTCVFPKVIENFIGEFGTIDWFTEKENEMIQSHEKYYAVELELNASFRTFAVNCSLLYGGHNTVAAQLKYNAKWAAQKGENVTPDKHCQRYLIHVTVLPIIFLL